MASEYNVIHCVRVAVWSVRQVGLEAIFAWTS